MTETQNSKSLVFQAGADLCGITPVDRFADAPPGFRPTDIFPDCKSVIVFARRLPVHSLFIDNCVPYTHVNDVITHEVDLLTIDIARRLEDSGMRVVIIPSDDPYLYWEPDRQYGRAILSLRHAGYLAGLGVLGDNTLLINDTYGNMIQLGAVLVDRSLDGDPLAEYDACPADCSLCIDACPVGALDGFTVNQQLCRPKSNFVTPKGYPLKTCSVCRSICPQYNGLIRHRTPK
ncbi:MAG: epoxyqueuosine reductase [candidate division Zixibacteria bacterium]|nr:epoxyqueuosine reductase [candidate division Zixibacteria bacterium]